MHRWLGHLARICAIAGAGLCLLVALVTVVSVLGRNLLDHPVLGDVELAQIGVAIGIALCLPWCQLRRAHIIVDFFTQRLSQPSIWVLDAAGAVLMTLTCLLLAWRTLVGAVSVHEAGETTMIMSLPMWWAYAGLVPGLLLTAAIAFWQAVLLLAGRLAVPLQDPSSIASDTAGQADR